MELQLILVLLIAFLLLGPEGMLNVATKLGELTRKARELIDQLRMEAYVEELNRKIMEEEERMKEEVNTDIAEELKRELEDATEGEEEKEKEEKVKDEQQRKTPGDAPDGTSERA